MLCCEKCGLDEWNGLPIPLELHHINGDRTDNRLENLQILCANCHAQTDNYCSKNKKSPSTRIGIGGGLKNPCPQGRVGSSPTLGTIHKVNFERLIHVVAE